MELLNEGFTYSKGLKLYHKGIQRVDDIWDSEKQDFMTWDRVQEKFNLLPTKVGDWAELTDKLFRQWRHLLDVDSNTTHPGQWIGDGRDFVFNRNPGTTHSADKWLSYLPGGTRLIASCRKSTCSTYSIIIEFEVFGGRWGGLDHLNSL